MKIFNYDSTTGAFLSETEADKDIDPHSPTGWFIPAYATTVAPPKFDQNVKSCLFKGDKWVVTKLPIPKLEVPVEPTEEEIYKALSIIVRSTRGSLLHEADLKINMLEDNGQNSKAWRVYRQALRDVTEQSTFPTSVVWPTRP